MRIGILTFHRADNYGAVLQSFALQETLRRKGHDVRVIDYRQPWIEEFYRWFSLRMFRRDGIPYLKKNLKKFLLAPCRRRNFAAFRRDWLLMTEPCTSASIPHDFDCYVIGSDQLWSLHCLGGEADKVYMGDLPHCADARIIGYAISADMKSVQAIGADVLKTCCQRFDALSMREAEVAHEVQRMSGMHCDVCIDPTLLADASVWESVVDHRWKERKYVLMYQVRWRKETKGMLRRKAEEAATRIGGGCEVIDLSHMNYSVQDFVSLFRYASHVVTTSFHGIVFSILFGTPFHALPLWDGYDLRYRELLQSLGAEDRIIGPDDEIVPGPMDFNAVWARLQDRRKYSYDFIDRNIGYGK